MAAPLRTRHLRRPPISAASCPGLSLRFGWGFSDRWTLLMDVAVTDLAVADTASYFLSHGDILMRWTPFTHRNAHSTWAPFLQGGLGFRDITGDFNDERIGMVTTHGRGVPGTSGRFGLGVNWHKGRAAR